MFVIYGVKVRRPGREDVGDNCYLNFRVGCLTIKLFFFVRQIHPQQAIMPGLSLFSSVQLDGHLPTGWPHDHSLTNFEAMVKMCLNKLGFAQLRKDEIKRGSSKLEMLEIQKLPLPKSKSFGFGVFPSFRHFPLSAARGCSHMKSAKNGGVQTTLPPCQLKP